MKIVKILRFVETFINKKSSSHLLDNVNTVVVIFGAPTKTKLHHQKLNLPKLIYLGSSQAYKLLTLTNLSNYSNSNVQYNELVSFS